MSLVDTSRGQVLINPFPEFHMVGFQHWIKLGAVGLSSILEFNVKAHPGSVWGKDIEILLSKNFQENGCPVGGSRGNMCDGPDARTRLLQTPSDSYFPGN